ncbi:MAG: hypothetical protein JWM93_3225, partial [Frankiales bacterium]|nr:hypothetical protein [Frankiales bacterium]
LLSTAGATTCIQNFALSANGHAVAWVNGKMVDTHLGFDICQATSVYVRNIDTGVTKKLVVDAAALADSSGVSVSFNHAATQLQVRVVPAATGGALFSVNALFTISGTRLKVSGSYDLGAFSLDDMAAPAGHVIGYDSATHVYVIASLTSSAAPTPLSPLDLLTVSGSPGGTKVAYVVGAPGALHAFVADADFSAPVDLGPVPDWSDTTSVSLGWVGEDSVVVAVGTVAGQNFTSATTVHSATDASVQFTSTQIVGGWLR